MFPPNSLTVAPNAVAPNSVHARFWPTSEAPFARYSPGETLFFTNFGEVRRVSLAAGGGPDMVVKISKLRGSNRENPIAEARILERLTRHAGNLFPKLFDEQIVIRDGEQWHFQFLQDCGDDLHTIMERLRQPLNEDSAHFLFVGLLKVVQVLHDLSICHLDLKPENILFSRKDSCVRVCDFGQACAQKSTEYQFGLHGTLGFRAPDSHDGKFCGFKADMFSLGVVLFFLLSCENVATREWEAVFQDEELFNQKMMHLSAEVRDLITGLVRPASSRLNLQQVRTHPWISREHLISIAFQF